MNKLHTLLSKFLLYFEEHPISSAFECFNKSSFIFTYRQINAEIYSSRFAFSFSNDLMFFFMHIWYIFGLNTLGTPYLIKNIKQLDKTLFSFYFSLIEIFCRFFYFFGKVSFESIFSYF